MTIPEDEKFLHIVLVAGIGDLNIKRKNKIN